MGIINSKAPMEKEYFIGDRRKYGITLMETIKLEDKLPHREIYKVKWISLTNYDGINTQVFPMIRTEGEFYDFNPISKSEYDSVLTTIKTVCEELKPLLKVKRQIDQIIRTAEITVWNSLGKQPIVK